MKKWDYNSCYQEALKYKSRSEFKKAKSGAFECAYKNNWLKDYKWFKKQYIKKWDYDSCYNEALKYKTKTDFLENNKNAYQASSKHGWLKEFTWLEKRFTWDYDSCYNEALKYKSRSDFKKGRNSAYNYARENGFLDDYVWFEKLKNPFSDKMDNVYAYFFHEQKTVYIGRTIRISKRKLYHSTKNKSAVFKFAKKHNLPIPNMTLLETNLSIEDGLKKEDYYINFFKNNGWEILNIAKTGELSGSIGAIANGKWSYNSCLEESKKYKTRTEFQKRSRGAYESSWRNGWLEEFVWLETPKHTPKKVVQMSLNGDTITIFNSINEAINITGCTHISACCLGKRKTCGGFKWGFLDKIN